MVDESSDIRLAEIKARAKDPAVVRQVADAIADNELGYHLSLTRLVDGIETWTLEMDGETHEFELREEGAAFVAAERRKRQAERVIDMVLVALGVVAPGEEARRTGP